MLNESIAPTTMGALWLEPKTNGPLGNSEEPPQSALFNLVRLPFPSSKWRIGYGATINWAACWVDGSKRESALLTDGQSIASRVCEGRHDLR